MFRDRTKFKINPKLFEELVQEKQARQADILEQINDHSKGNERFVVSASKILEVASNASELFLSESSRVSSKKRLLQFILSNPTWDGDKLIFNLKSPFDAISETVKNDSWGE